MPTLDIISGDIVTAQTLDIIEAAPRPGLGGEPTCSQTRRAIEAMVNDHRSIAATATSQPAETMALAGLWLLAGELDLSHELSQSIETATGSYWHGIMHRREGDSWNSKYWYRRAARHPTLDELAGQIAQGREQLRLTGPALQQLCAGQSVGETLVDLCEAAAAGKASTVADLELICWWEWQLLFRFSLAT